MADLLLEFFSEEIPARMQAPAARDLQRMLEEGLKSADLFAGEIKTYVTPRRLALIASGIPAMQKDRKIERKGPKTDAPQQAIEGFLRSTGLSVKDLEKHTVGKDEVYFAVTDQKGRPTSDLLKEMIDEIAKRFPWPKSMRWGAHSVRWVRPLHSILCLFDGMVVPVEFGPVKAGNITYGHRFHAPKSIAIRGPNEYIDRLREAYVIADQAERKDVIRIRAEQMAKKNGLTLKVDEGLLEEVTGLVEWPVPLVGMIDDDYMQLPPEVLVSEMRAHQKYFALINTDGTLASKFLITANVETADGGKQIVKGNERVLRARFADGRFFWDQDCKRSLKEWGKGLDNVTYHEKLGSTAQKVVRVAVLAERIAKETGANAEYAKRAAELCKADLLSGMVGEFPELQGIMGAYYASAQGENEIVAGAIRDHYRPQGPNDNVPVEPAAICVAVADKLDTLIGMFAIGEKPTGSKDPFALRRAALGVIRILRENDLHLPLANLVVAKDSDGKELMGFFRDRLKVMLRDEGVRHDVIDCAYGATDPSFESGDLYRISRYIKAFNTMLATSKGTELTQLAKRVLNILAIEEKKDGTRYDGKVTEAKLGDAEKTLHDAISQSATGVENGLKKEDYDHTMMMLLNVQVPLAAFFDTVMVNDTDKALRKNRLYLLARLRAVLDKCGDFAQLEG